MTRIGSVFAVVAMALLLNSLATGQVKEDTPCIAAGETVYHPGSDKVKPPTLIKPPKAKEENSPKIRGSMLLEMLVNSSGQVCSVRIVKSSDKSSDQESARKIAQFISEKWKFNPAMRDGKPVAVAFQVNFNGSH